MLNASIRCRRPFFFYISKYLYSDVPDNSKHKYQRVIKSKYETANELALKHFDQFYVHTYSSLWPSIRLALLSVRKPAALINNFHQDKAKVHLIMKELGAVDIFSELRSSLISLASTVNQEANTVAMDVIATEAESMAVEEIESTMLRKPQLMGSSSRSNVDEFMPVTEVVSEHNLYHRQGDVALTSDSMLAGLHNLECVSEDSPVDLLSATSSLQVMVLPRGSLRTFPRPQSDHCSLFSYYPLDFGSALAAAIVNPQPGHSILDMCAAPGGKTLLLLQNLTSGRVVAVDSSSSRLHRLVNMLNAYCPNSMQHDGSVQVMHCNALKLEEHTKFDRVLVDAPCSTDRDAVTSMENNLFGRERRNERRNLPRLQMSLIRKAVHMARVGGEIVYSTCSLSAAQNEGAVLAAISGLNAAGIRVAAVDLSPIVTAAASRCRVLRRPVGLLITPYMPENYGPTYMCKLRRLS